MPKSTDENFSICIILSDNSSVKEENINSALSVCPQVIFLSFTENEAVRNLAKKMNLQFIVGTSNDDLVNAARSLTSEWLLCIKSTEFIKHSSLDTLKSSIKDNKQQIYGIFIREYINKNDYYDFSFIRNLGQYNKLNEEAGIIKVEPRLVRKKYLGEIIKYLTAQSDVTLPYSKLIHGLQLVDDAWQQDKPASEEEKDHDLLCLKGQISHDSVRADNIDELNPGFIGFKVVNMGYLEGYLEIAKRGWGSDNMYIHMFKFLIQNGKFEDAKAIYDLWEKNRYGDENDLVNSIGGCIYANLFLFEEAIALYEKALKYCPDQAFFETLGRLYLILNNRDKAIINFNKALAISPSKLIEETLAIINNPNWHPLKLSACIIARDEEKTISDSILSLKNIADEIIVVDTGSQDSTIQISTELGCKVVTMTWNDDFSEVRNRAIEEATGDYILMLDADEYIDNRDKIGLLLTKCLLFPNLNMAYRAQFKDKENSQSFSVALLNSFLNKETFEFPVRLFPRLPGLRYSGFVFESVEDSLGKISTTIFPFLRITKQNNDVLRRNERKKNAVKKAAASLENSNIALDCALFYLRSNDWSEALECFNKTNNIDPALAANIVNYYAIHGKLKEAKSLAVRVLTDHPESLDLNLALAAVYFQDENYAAIYNTLFPFFQEKIDKIPAGKKGDFLYYLGISALEKNHNNDAIDYIARALENNLLDTRYQIAGLYAFAKSDNWEQFIGAAEKIVRQEKIAIDFEIKDFSDLGRLIFRFIEYFSQINRNEETAILRKIIAHMIFAKFINIEEIDRLTKTISAQSNLYSIH